MIVTIIFLPTAKNIAALELVGVFTCIGTFALANVANQPSRTHGSAYQSMTLLCNGLLRQDWSWVE